MPPPILLTSLLHEAKQVIQKFLPLGVRIEFIQLGKDQGHSPHPLAPSLLEPQFRWYPGQEFLVKGEWNLNVNCLASDPLPGAGRVPEPNTFKRPSLASGTLGSSNLASDKYGGGEGAGRHFSGSVCSSGQSLDHHGHLESQEGSQAGAKLHTQKTKYLKHLFIPLNLYKGIMYILVGMQARVSSGRKDAGKILIGTILSDLLPEVITVPTIEVITLAT